MSADRPEAVGPGEALGRLRRVLLFDSQPDHVELIRRAIRDSFPATSVEVVSNGAMRPSVAAAPDVVLLSLNVDHDAALSLLGGWRGSEQPAPPVLLLRGPGERWPDSARRSVEAEAELDKKEGAAFLGALMSRLEAVDAGRIIEKPAARRAPAPAAACTLPFVAALLEIDPGGVVRRVDPLAGRPAAARGGPLAEGETLASLTGLAVSEIPEDRLVPLPDDPAMAACRLRDEPSEPAGTRTTVLLVGRRTHSGAPRVTPAAVRARLLEGRTTDAVSRIAHLAGSLKNVLDADGELRQTGAASAGAERLFEEVERLRGLCSPAAAPRRLPVGARILVSLREPIWRRWSGGARVTTRIEPRLPLVEVAPEIMGPWIDGLVTSLAAWAGDDATISIELARPPIRPGDPLDSPCAVRRERIVHLTITASPSAPEAAGAAPREASGVDGWTRIGPVVAEWHGGSFEWSELEGGPGCRAELTLPAAPREASCAPRGEKDPPPAVLVADDDASVRSVLAKLLDSLGCRSVEVESGEDAVSLVGAGCRYDLVLLDMMMGGIDGAETFERLRRADPSARVVFCSGSPGASGIRRGLAAGALGFVAKPVGLGALAELVGMASARPVGPPGGTISGASRSRSRG